VQDAINELYLPGISQAVRVSRSASDQQRGFTWFITFSGVQGNVDPLQIVPSLTGAAATGTVRTVQDGNMIGGSWHLVFSGRRTVALSHNAPAEASIVGSISVKEALEALPGLTVVKVDRSLAQNGYEWKITFYDTGDMPPLEAVSTDLTGLGASVSVRELSKGISEAGSRLALSFLPPRSSGGSTITKYLVEWDLSPTLASPDHREATISDAGLLLEVQRVELLVGTDQDAFEPVASGTFQIAFGIGGLPTNALAYDASANDMRDALE